MMTIAQVNNETNITPIELFFALITLFAFTQLSHNLFLHLTLHGILQTGVMWFAVWLVWQNTFWITDFVDLKKLPVNLLLFGIMLVSVLMASVISTAFNYNGLIFALCYVTMQSSRTLIVLLFAANKHESPYFRRRIGWLCLCAGFWILGGFSESDYRLAYWALAVSIECIAINTVQLKWRYQSLIIVALSGALFAAGLSVSNTLFLSPETIVAFIVVFSGSLAMWWLYSETSSKEISLKRETYLQYIHVILIAGIICFAVAGELMISDPSAHLKTFSLIAMVAGPSLYLIGNALFKMNIYHHFPISHLLGILAFILLVPLAEYTDTLRVGGIIVMILLIIAMWERSLFLK